MKTIHFREFEFKVKYNYRPAERQTHDDPGCEEEFEFHEITLNGIEASWLLSECMDDFEEEAIEQIKYR
jgi:hypothetical protein